jgi:hypothetical protein
MQAKNEISEELRSLSPLLDTISRHTPYGVPEGYFFNFPERLLQRIGGGNVINTGVRAPGADDAAGETTGSGVLPPVLSRKGGNAPFQVPEGYFEGFAGSVLDRIRKGQSGNAPLETAGSPANGMASERQDDPALSVTEELAMLSPLLSRIDRKTPFQVPEGYFDEISPILLTGVKHKPLYEVPEGYFDELAGKIAAKVQSLTPAVARVTPATPVILMTRMNTWRKYTRYAAAAVVAGLILTIGWLRLHTSGHAGNTGTVDVAGNLTKASDQELENYFDNHNVPLAESVVNNTATLDVNDSDVNGLLGDVPDGELKQYMEEHGAVKDLATN